MFPSFDALLLLILFSNMARGLAVPVVKSEILSFKFSKFYHVAPLCVKVDVFRTKRR